MTKVNVTKQIKVPASSAWEKFSAFEGLEQFAPLKKTSVTGKGVGAKRTCVMQDDSEFKEELTKLDHDNMLLEYIILSGPLPITDYVSTITVKPVDLNNCEVSWGSQFNTEAEEDMKNMLGGFYNITIENLESLIIKEAAIA